MSQLDQLERMFLRTLINDDMIDFTMTNQNVTDLLQQMSMIDLEAMDTDNVNVTNEAMDTENVDNVEAMDITEAMVNALDRYRLFATIQLQQNNEDEAMQN